ncbi:MAG: flagellar biosynthetic protein FliR [Thermoleophilia bacterium]
MIELIRTFQANVLLFGLLLIRVSAMFTLAPIFNSRVVPAKIRAAAAVMLSMATLPMLADGTLRMPDSMLAYAILGAKEVIIGALIGLIAQLLFASVQLAGSLIDTGAGFSIGQSLDPTSNLNLSTMGQAYNLFARRVRWRTWAGTWCSSGRWWPGLVPAGAAHPRARQSWRSRRRSWPAPACS